MATPLNTSKLFDSTFIPQWLKLFSLTLLAYFSYITEFMWGNHDWQWIKENTPFLSGLFEGRFSQFILQTSLTETLILPISTITLAIAFYTLGITLFINLFFKNRTPLSYILIGLFISTSPYSISWLYFAFITLSCFSWPFFIILAFFITYNNNIKLPYYTKYLISTILFLLALGGYPPSINMICSIFFISIINNICFNNYTLKLIIKKALPLGISISLSVALLLTIQYFLKKYNIQQETYNTASITLANIDTKFIQTLSLSLKQFINQTTFIGYLYKYLTLCITLTALYILIIKLPKTCAHITLFTLSIIGLLISSILTSFIAQNINYVMFEPRIEFFGLLYIYAYSTITLFKQNNQLIKNLSFIIIILLIFNNINTLNYSLKIWKLGFKGETSLINRIINRIELQKNFHPIRKYTFIQSGVLNYRERFHTPSPVEDLDSYTLLAPYIPWHLPSKAYKFYTTTDYFGNDYDVFWQYIPRQLKTMYPNLPHYIKTQATIWPHPNSIFIQNDLMVLILNKQILQNAKIWSQIN